MDPRSNRAWSLIAATAVLVFAATTPSVAQTWFHEIISDPTPTDFRTLVSFQTPSGSGAGQKTIIRVVTNIPQADLLFQVQPVTAGSVGNRNAPSFAVGTHVVVEESGGLPGDVAEDVFAETVAEPVATGFAMYRVTIDYTDTYAFAAAETWQLKVHERVPAWEYFGFAATTDAGATRAKLDVPTGLNFGDVQESVTAPDAPVKGLQARNLGTGPLTFSSATINPSGTFTRPVWSPGAPLVPGQSMTNDWAATSGLWIMASPPALGDQSATLAVTVTVTPPTVTPVVTETANIPLSAHGVSLYAHLLLDVSLSMGDSWDGKTWDVPEPESRLWQAKLAGAQITEWIDKFSSGRAYLGLTSFGGTGVVRRSIDRASVSGPSIQTNLGDIAGGGLQPNDGTPMEDGIVKAHANMEARITGPLPPEPGDRPNLRQAILLLSDGDQTTGNAANQINPLKTASVRVYTVGYGVPDQAQVNFALLEAIATGTEGAPFMATATDPFAVKNAFRKAVTPWLGLQPVQDPEGTIRAGQMRSHDVCLDASVDGVSFVVDWARNVTNGISVQLRTPSGEMITPTSTSIAYRASHTYAMYTIRGNRLRGGQGAGRWTMSLTGGSVLPSDQDTRYAYTVVAHTPALVELPIVKAPWFTGLDALYEVRISGVEPAILSKTRVLLRYSAPGRSFNSYLAEGRIDPAWVLRRPGSDSIVQKRWVPETLMSEPATVRARKAYALAYFADQPFDEARTEDSLQLYDDGTHGDRVARDSIYTTRLPTLKYDGIHNLDILVTGPDIAPGGCFVRDIRTMRYVPVHLTTANLTRSVAVVGIDSSQFFDASVWKMAATPPPAGYERKVIRVRPRDDQGNYLGPGFAKELTFTLTGAEAVAGPVENWDGGILIVVQYRKGVRPTAVVSIGDVTSEPVQVVPRRFALWLIVLVAVIALVIVLLRRRRPAVPVIVLALGAGLGCEKGPQPQAGTLPIYRVATTPISAARVAQVASLTLGVSGEVARDADQLTLRSGTNLIQANVRSGGFWVADESRLWNPTLTPSLPDSARARAIAEDYFARSKLLPTLDRQPASISQSSLGGTRAAFYDRSTGRRSLRQLDVQVNYSIKMAIQRPESVLTLPVVGGGGEFNLTLGNDGVIIGYSGVWRPIERIETESPVITPERADSQFQALAKGLTIRSAESFLAYHSAPSPVAQQFLYPVYVYRATAIINGTEVPMRLITIPATEWGPKPEPPAPIRRRTQQDLPPPGTTVPEGPEEREPTPVQPPAGGLVNRPPLATAGRSPAQTSWREAGTSWIGLSGGLAGSQNNAKGFVDGLQADGWSVNFNWGDATAWESDWRRNDDSWVDAADFVFYTGHASMNGWVLSSPDDGSLNFSEVGTAPAAPGDLWGDADIEWFIVAACGPLQDDVISAGGGDVFARWDGAFDRLHQLLGYAAITFDTELEGKSVVQYARAGATIINAWFRTGREIQPSSNGAGAPDGPTVWVGVMYVYRSGTTSPANDHIWLHGSVAPDPTSPNIYVAMWTTT